MNGLHRSELNSAEGDSRIREKLLTLKEVADFLGFTEEEVKDFVTRGKISAYKLGGELLRFKKDEIEALREKIEISKRRVKYSFRDRIKDFVYFNNFYFFAAILIAILLFIILRHR